MWPGLAHTGPMADSSMENTELLSQLACPVRQFMYLIGLLTATEKQVDIGLAMRPFYYATIAYHVGLIAVLGWPQGITANF